MKRPASQTSKCNVCVAIAASAALCVSPALAFAEDADQAGEAPDAAASAPAENEGALPEDEDPNITENENPDAAVSENNSSDPSENESNPAISALESPLSSTKEGTSTKAEETGVHKYQIVDIVTREVLKVGESDKDLSVTGYNNPDLLREFKPARFYRGHYLNDNNEAIIYVTSIAWLPEETSLTYNRTAQTIFDNGAFSGYVVVDGPQYATNVGTYRTTIEISAYDVNGNPEYVWSDTEYMGSFSYSRVIEWSITPAYIKKPTAKTGLVYNGYSQEGIEGHLGGFRMWGDFEATLPGTYTCLIIPDEGFRWWEDDTVDPVMIEWTIDPLGRPEQPTANTGLAYTGSEQMGVDEGEGYTLSGDYKATEIGTYTATATLEEGYVWADGSTDPVEIEWSIDHATANKPTAITGLVYTGESQTGVAEGTGYTLSGTVEATDAGDYTATATLDENHKWMDSQGNPTFDDAVISWSIEHAEVALPQGGISTYDGNERSILTEEQAGKVAVVDGTISETEIGEYTATVKPEKNYKWAGAEGNAAFEEVEISWSIEPIDHIKQPEANTGLTYNGKTQRGVDEGKGYTLSGDVEASLPGTYTATATLEEGYVWSDGSTDPVDIEWSIEHIAIKAPAGKHLTYNGKLQRGVDEGKGYTLSGTLEATEVGIYTATATLEEGYAWSDGSTDPVKVKWSINPEKPLAKTGDETPIAGFSLTALLAAAAAGLGLSRRKRDC